MTRGAVPCAVPRGAGPWPGEPTAQTKFPLYHYIDYVKVAQPESR